MMISDEVDVVRCPHCGTDHRAKVLLSFGSGGYGTVPYSDGHWFGSRSVGEKEVDRCARCRAYLWMDDLRQLAGESGFPTTDRNSRLPWFSNLRGAEFAEALEAGASHTPEQELYLRRNLWWAMQHADRAPSHRMPGPFPRIGDETQYVANALAMDRLLADLEATPRNLLMRAEVNRNLGRFAEAMELLARVEDERLLKTRDQIAEACAAQLRTVIEILPEEEPPAPPPPPSWWERIWKRGRP